MRRRWISLWIALAGLALLFACKLPGKISEAIAGGATATRSGSASPTSGGSVTSETVYPGAVGTAQPTTYPGAAQPTATLLPGQPTPYPGAVPTLEPTPYPEAALASPSPTQVMALPTGTAEGSASPTVTQTPESASPTASLQAQVSVTPSPTLSDVYPPVDTVSATESGAYPGLAAGTPTIQCDPAYPDYCIPPPPPDLNCEDIDYRNFRVNTPDPHAFDGDNDGFGCDEGTPSTTFQPTGTFASNLTPSATSLPTVTPTIFETPTALPTITLTPTPTRFMTPTPTLTRTPTLTYTPLPLPPWVSTQLRATDPRTVQLASGRVQLIMFFAYWNGPSQAMAPVVQGVEREYASRMNFIYLDTDDPATKTFQQQLGFDAEPQFFLLDPQGRVLNEWLGYVTVEAFRAAFNAALNP